MTLPPGPSWPVRLAFFALGFLPISALGVAVIGWVPLDWSAKLLVGPAVLGLLLLAWAFPQARRLALVGFLAGVVATGAYDATRLSLVALGWWPEFIPAIGRLALADDAASPLWGYAWRFLLNGGCMGLAFAMLPWHGLRAGVVYGSAVCCCLWASLWLGGPKAEALLFPLNPATALFSWVGHVDYGAVLGFLVARWAPAFQGPSLAPSPQLGPDSSEA